MKQYTFSDMNRSSGEILEAAMLEPVVLTKHGKEKLVIVSARDYHRMRGEPSPTKSYSLHEAPENVQMELMSGIDAILGPDKNDA